MNIQIHSHEIENETSYFEMTSGKRSAHINYNRKTNCVNIVCKNASHSVWRGSGKYFWGGWDEAIKGYKSAEMQAMIVAAENLCKC